MRTDEPDGPEEFDLKVTLRDDARPGKPVYGATFMRDGYVAFVTAGCTIDPETLKHTDKLGPVVIFLRPSEVPEVAGALLAMVTKWRPAMAKPEIPSEPEPATEDEKYSLCVNCGRHGFTFEDGCWYCENGE